ncbi:hypothetical protein PGC08_15480 [Brevibacterium sp. BDJS002]|uniref:hypothetical protein n=1 Tax=Brevibacterium sp. BDJS002 TaxID=3020906 RepID=UPI002306E887|nr:hypothetical protein [Brevibacterium sp. BDJS002]WCE39387.1 hypothetical protein PGC08_15480 [Brevibacterium sp. BDJS002]
MRKAVRDDEKTGPGIDYDRNMWRIRSFEAARQVLRARQQTTQAGFTAEKIPRGYFRHHPILISDGDDHDGQRREVARFFAPAVVSAKYGDFISDRAQTVVDGAVAEGTCRVDDIALAYSVEVTATVVGLTESSVAGMSKRLVGFFKQPPVDLSAPSMDAHLGNGCRPPSTDSSRLCGSTPPMCAPRSGPVVHSDTTMSSRISLMPDTALPTSWSNA